MSVNRRLRRGDDRSAEQNEGEEEPYHTRPFRSKGASDDYVRADVLSDSSFWVRKTKMKQFSKSVLVLLVLANYAAKADEQEAIKWKLVEQAAADQVNSRCPALAEAGLNAKLHRP